MVDDVDSQGNKTISKLVATDDKTRTYELSDNTYEERVNGSASWRHNNPGNLKMEYAHSADPTVHSHRSKEDALASAVSKYPGTVDLDQRGNVIFDSYDHGRDAQIKFIKKDGDGKTVAQMLGDYSKPDYSGPTHHQAQEATIYAVGDKAGVDLRTKTIDKMSDAEISALADGISKFEGYTKGQTNALTPEQAAERQTRAQQGIHDAPAHDAGHPHTLKHGDKGAEVGAVQQQLHDLGYHDSRGNLIGVDNHFGPTTEAAVKAFQTDHGLKPDGVAGPATQQQLHSAAQSNQLNDPGISSSLTQKLDQPGVKTGDPHMDKLLASMNDPVAFKQAMTDLSSSPYGQAFHAEGRAQHAEMQNQQVQAQVTQQQVQQQAQPQPQVQTGPVMTR